MESFLQALTTVLGGTAADGTRSISIAPTRRTVTIHVNHGSGPTQTWVAPYNCYAVYATCAAASDVVIATINMNTTNLGSGVVFTPGLICRMFSGRFCEMRHFIKAGETIWFNSASTGALETLVVEIV